MYKIIFNKNEDSAARITIAIFTVLLLVLDILFIQVPFRIYHQLMIVENVSSVAAMIIALVSAAIVLPVMIVMNALYFSEES